jgi:hypothetical protein
MLQNPALWKCNFFDSKKTISGKARTVLSNIALCEDVYE